MKKLVLIGAGHAHIVALRRLSKYGFHITLISPDAIALYSGLLPDYIAGNISLPSLCFDLKAQSKAMGFKYVDDTVDSICLTSKSLVTSEGMQHDFDALSINIGSVPHQKTITDTPPHHCSIKPFSKFLPFYKKYVRDMKLPPRSIGIVGAGPGGIEIAFAIQRYLEKERSPVAHTSSSLAEPSAIHVYGTRLLDTLHPSHTTRIAEHIANKGIQLHIAPTRVKVADLTMHDCVLWSSHAHPPQVLHNIDIAKDEQGFLLVTPQLQSTSHPFVFAAGDCSALVTVVLEKSGATAYMQGPILSHNIINYLQQESLTRTAFSTQLRTFRSRQPYLKILNRGDGYAMASKGKWYAEGRAIYAFKNYLDYAFMRRYA